MTKYKAIIYVLIAAVFSAMGQILFKYTSKDVTSVFSFFLNGYFYLAGICFALGFIFLMIALKTGDATTIYPILASSYVYVCLISPFLFKTDFMSIQKWIGVFVIISGIYFIINGSRND
jgi:uncharacterized membrane protein